MSMGMDRRQIVQAGAAAAVAAPILRASHLDDGVANLDEHLVILVSRLGAGVLLVVAAALASAVIEDCDDGGTPRLIILAAAGFARRMGAATYDQSGRAPVITIFDHRGCQRGSDNKEYTGPKSGDQDDEMLVKVGNP
eukprot:CAMPEP_0173125904 /NCGR_PEP_ID=MMETSP1102-20130122/56731_2 /TAXON_ID=49646 /ORGANISM="Geminigera sp., Strain Caron Lab Isolate" /LENGTH=137 /DNA_ID=CAMNT_0014034935 /DNA_START=191 /DNA_END=601 /DNA_ORIENTATION=-